MVSDLRLTFFFVKLKKNYVDDNYVEHMFIYIYKYVYLQYRICTYKYVQILQST